MVFNDTDGLYTYTFEAEKKVTLESSLFSIITVMQGKLNGREDVFNIYLLLTEFEVCTVSYGPSFFSLIFTLGP